MTESIKMLLEVTSKDGANLIGVRNYTNKQGQVANYLINAGVDRVTAMAHDADLVRKANANDLAEATGYSTELVTIVLGELMKSMTKPDQKRSDGQTNAYDYIGNGIKRHTETGDIYVTGVEHTKPDIIKEGEPKKPVKSSDKTLCKRKVERELGFKTIKLRNFKLANGAFKIRGNLF